MNQSYYTLCQLPNAERKYRGIQRLGPIPPTDPLKSAELSLACLQYIEKGERFATRDEAIRMWELLGGARSGFEVIRVVPDPSMAAESARGFLGYDITDVSGWNSILSWDWSRGPSWDNERDNLVLLRAIFDLFGRERNTFGLFSEFNTARRFARSLQALATLSPGTVEAPEAEIFLIFAIISETHPSES